MQITDRAKDVIKSGGEWISSIDLENLAVGHPKVAEAAVIGVSHPKWDERPLLVIVLKKGETATKEEILGFMDRRARAALILDSDLRTAIDKNQFVLHYQPQIALRTGRVTGAEALLRWQRPGHGLVGPSEFLARAEENGLIIPINEWALREACRQARLWQQRGHPPTRVGVNM